MKTLIERPGAQTPWPYINNLLTADECFEQKKGDWHRYLLAPKSSARLSALLYLLKEHQMTYRIQGKGTRNNNPLNCEQICLSTRALTHINWLEDSVVAIEAGCDLRTLHSMLWQERKEIGLELGLGTEGKGSIGGAIVTGCPSGVILKGIPLPQRLLGVELIKSNGGSIKLGSRLKGAIAGPPIHQLLWGIGSMPALITKVFLLTESLPEMRLYLHWSFEDRHDLWHVLEKLQQWTHSWERLDCVIPGHYKEKCFIMAQISGSISEMNRFKSLCPYVDKAQLEDRVPVLTQFIRQKALNLFNIEGRVLSQPLIEGEYYWFHALTNQGWLGTSQKISHSSQNATDVTWKRHLFSIL